MTTPTEEERKAAAELVESRKDELFAEYGPFSSGGTRQAVYLQVQLTRTKKRLKEAEGLLRELTKEMQAVDLKERLSAFLNPPAEGE